MTVRDVLEIKTGAILVIQVEHALLSYFAPQMSYQNRFT